MPRYKFSIPVVDVSVSNDVWGGWEQLGSRPPQPITLTLEADGKTLEDAAANLSRTINRLVADENDGDLVRRRI